MTCLDWYLVEAQIYRRLSQTQSSASSGRDRSSSDSLGTVSLPLLGATRAAAESFDARLGHWSRAKVEG